MSRSVPGCRHRLVSTPLRLATPRWVVDRDFDVSYHLRWIAAPQPKTLDTVLEYARQSAMSGLDRDRPLWSFTVVEGLEGGRAAVVVKLHHVLTDGTWYALPRPSSTPPARPATWGRCQRFPTDNLTSYSLLTPRAGAEEMHEDVPAGRGRTCRVKCSRSGRRHPVSAADTAVRNLRSLGRLMKPPAQSLSPIMVERRLVTVRDARRRSRSLAEGARDAAQP